MISQELITGCLTKFERFDISQKQIEHYHGMVGTRKPYIICFTPRSGSSYLADRLTQCQSFGAPGEYFNAGLMDLTLHSMRERGYTGMTIVDYLVWLMQNLSSANGVFGFKVSYFDYQPLIASGLDKLLFGSFKPIFLYRNNILKQAVSLYIATETSLFHTNIPVVEETRKLAESLPYNREKIRFWIKHLWLQEKAWKNYLDQQNRVFPVIDYDEVSNHLVRVLRLIAQHLDSRLSEDVAAGESVFQKVRTLNNDKLVANFLEDNSLQQKEAIFRRMLHLIGRCFNHSETVSESNMDFFLGLGLDKSRLVGE